MAHSDPSSSTRGATRRPGTLWVVATPIGHLDDLGARARHLLETVPVIAAEDTRTSRRLVEGRSGNVTWLSLHEHNESHAASRVLDRLAAGDDVALVSDAGTPLISDPGYRLVGEARRQGFPVSPVPGPCAAIAALSAGGLPTDRFSFQGFPPARAAARRARFESLAGATETLVFYVPARDLPGVLSDMASAFGTERAAVVARELTKQFETIRDGGLGALAEWVSGDPDQQRGEAVVLVEGAAGKAASDIDARRLARELAAELPPARAARVLARVTGLSRREAFDEIERLRADERGD